MDPAMDPAMDRSKKRKGPYAPSASAVVDLTRSDDDTPDEPPGRAAFPLVKRTRPQQGVEKEKTLFKIIADVVDMGFERTEVERVAAELEEKAILELDCNKFVDLVIRRANPSHVNISKPTPASALVIREGDAPSSSPSVSPSKPKTLAPIFLKATAKPQSQTAPTTKGSIDIKNVIDVEMNSAPSSPLKKTIRKSEPTVESELQQRFRVAHPAVCWTAGEPVPYAHLSRLFSQLEQMSARLRITDVLTELFLCVLVMRSEDLLPSYYLCSRHIAPPYSGIQLGVGESVVMRGISAATGRTNAALVADLHTLGDLGDVAQASRCNQRLLGAVATLTVQKVYTSLRDIAMMKGHSSMNSKVGVIQKLLTSAREEEAKYLVRTITANLRIGVLERTLIVGLARATVLHELMTTGKLKPEETRKHMIALEEETASKASKASKSPVYPYGEAIHQLFQRAERTLKKVVSELPNYDVVIPALMQYGIDALPSHCGLTPGTPVRPMLAHPTRDLAELRERFGDEQAVSCEFKYDGERAQIHCLPDGSVKIFSRNCEESTVKFPDVISAIQSYFNTPSETGPIQSFVLDAEVCAFDREKKELLSFQVLSSRARKLVQATDLKTRLCVFVFDLLFLNGKSVLDEPLSKRRELLRLNFKEQDGIVQFVRRLEIQSLVTDEEKLLSFLQSALEYKCEGLMLKSLASAYEPSKRSLNWLKLKRDYMDGGGDTFDLVVIGAFHGRGRRAGWFGSYLLAVYDDNAEEFQAVCKCMTGFSDAFFESTSALLRQNMIAQPKSYYRPGGLLPDVWVEPLLVWEVIAAGMSLSPVASAAIGLVDSVRGISLRFPRFKRQRDDKGIHDATTGRQLAQMYRSQNKAPLQQEDDEDDLYDDDA